MVKSKIKGRRVKGGTAPPSTGSTGMNPFNRADAGVVPLRFTNVPTRIPRNITSIVVWDVVKVDSTITSSLSAVVETGFAFSLNTHPQQANWSALFDQWSIPFASVTFQSLYQPGATLVPPLIATALDFDNIAPIGSLSNIEDFASCEATVMSVGTKFTRTVRPCVKIGSYNGTALVASTPTPSWNDAASPGIQNLGIRSLLAQSAGVFQVRVTQTIWYAFRNAI